MEKFFGTEAQFWMNLQSHYDLEVARDAIAGKLGRQKMTVPVVVDMRRSARY